jgi:hypothetical protein
MNEGTSERGCSDDKNLCIYKQKKAPPQKVCDGAKNIYAFAYTVGRAAFSRLLLVLF